MIVYRKESGYPINCKIKTSKYEEILEDNDIWKGYKSVIIDENNEEISSFLHSTLSSRVLWANGFMEGIKYENSRKL